MFHNIPFFSGIFKVDIGSIRTTSKSIFIWIDTGFSSYQEKTY
jgi:hypothetical protein